MTDAEGEGYKHFTYTPYGEAWVEEHLSSRIHRMSHRFTGQELDPETGLYAFPARNYDPRTSRWLSADPALEEYLPIAPTSDEAREHNQNLPGMGGVFTPVNLQIYHYGGNNPIKYTDPTGENNEVADMHVWEATFAELTVSSYIALGEGGSGVSTGSVYVHFLNRETGESFEAMYTFTLDSIGDSEVLKPLGAAAVSVGGGIDFGMVTGSFPSDFSPEDIAESFSGNFINTSLSLPLVGPLGVTGTGITSESWSGFSFAASLGWGGGFAEMITHYSEPFNMTPLRGPLSPSQERARQRW